MKHIIITLTIFLALSTVSKAQSIDYTQELPSDKTIKKGVLPNGMTYYLKNTNVVKGAASYYIIQNVGSILENDEQQGLAHFLEHMAFNGTKNFPGKGILNTLQKEGAVFGKDINAYTSFDETVYNLSNIPTKDGLVDTCLTILNDWSNFLLLTDEEIDAERGVIKEEWRTRQNGQMRLYQTSLPITFNHSKYAKRLPIGLMPIVEGFKYKALRDFYHDWYRTDLQAIAVIGDINIDEIEQKIIKQFSKIEAIKNPKERFVVNVPDNKEMLYSFGMDPEISTASINFGIRHKKSLKKETIADLKQSLLESMAVSMLSARINEESQNPEAAFLDVSMSYQGGWSRTANDFIINIYPKENQQQAAFTSVITAIESAVKFGYIDSEIQRIKTNYKSFYENEIAQENNRSHAQIQRDIQSNYLENTTITDIIKEYQITKQIFNVITKEDLHNTIKRLYKKENRYLNVTGVEGQDNLTEKQAQQIVTTLENATTISPYSENLAGQSLISGINIKPGTIKNKATNKKLKATSYTLSNGIKVHYKFVDKEKDKVALKAISYGGKSLLNDNQLPSANLITSLVSMSGLGDFNATDLNKILAGKTANATVSLGGITENVYGSSNTKDVETMLQMVHLRFVKPRFDEKAYKVLESNIDNYIASRTSDINEQMKDSITIAIYGKNNPKKPIFNTDFTSKIAFNTVENIYRSRFADASDFEFFIVGDVKEQQLTPLLEQYIASIPTKNTTENYINNNASWISNTINKDIYIAMEDPKASINITYKKEMEYTLKNAIYTQALGDVLQLRVTETVRESEGGAYSPKATAYLIREPKSQAYISFNFDCNPELADKLVTIVNAELQKIANGDINKEDLNKTRTNFIKDREQSQNKNGFDMSLLTNYYRYNYNMKKPKNFDKIVKKMCTKHIKKIAAEVLNKGKSFQIVFKPKQ